LPDIEVRGADQLVRLSKRLRQVGNKDLKKELRTALREATKPVQAAIRRHAEDSMPKRGGLNRVMARSRISTQIRGSGNSPGIRLASKSHDPRINRGRLRHPVYGHRDRWVTQRVPEGWFVPPTGQATRAAQVQLLAAMKRIERELERR